MGRRGVNIFTPFDADAEKALELMLNIFGKSDMKDKITKQIRKSYLDGSDKDYIPLYLNPLKFTRRRLTIFGFRGLGDILGMMVVSDIFIVQTDPSATGYEKLHNFIERKYKDRYDMFEFDGDDRCFVAYD